MAIVSEVGRLGLKAVYYEEVGINGESPKVYDQYGWKLSRRYLGAERDVWHMQNSLALQLRSKLNNRMGIELSAGLGTSFYFAKHQSYYDEFNNKVYNSIGGWGWDPFNPYLRIGFYYCFKTRKQTKT